MNSNNQLPDIRAIFQETHSVNLILNKAVTDKRVISRTTKTWNALSVGNLIKKKVSC